MPTFTDRLKHAWNAFQGRDPTPVYNYGLSSSYRPDRPRLTRGNERSIVASIYNRIAVDVAAINIEHVRLDDNGRYVETVKDGLNNILTLDANIDQTGRAFIQDIVMSMFDEGVVAVVPIDTNISPKNSASFEINTMRTGKIVEWFPKHVKVRLYNDRTGRKEDLILPKTMVAIIENPFYSIMNEPNSTLQRLIRTINRLDAFNEQNTSGKLDLIIQLPYTIKTDARRMQAENRRKDIEMQLTGSKYGIAYADSTERITQLNRPVENNLWNQVKDLTTTLYNQLGLAQTIFDGTADEKTMLNYYSRTIDPILSAIAEAFMRTFLTKTARTQGHAIRYFRDPFKLVPIKDLAEISNSFTRNEIATSNEIRAEIGWKPSDNPRADELVNPNVNPLDGEMGAIDELGEVQNGGEMEGEIPEEPEEGELSPEIQEILDMIEGDDESELLPQLEKLLAILEEEDLGEDDEDEMEQKDDDMLALFHAYASKYYDPVKAHEYYMRTRKLKGRKKGMSIEQLRLVNKSKSKIKEISQRQKNGGETDQERQARLGSTAAHAKNKVLDAKKTLETAKTKVKSMSRGKKKRLRNKLRQVVNQLQSQQTATNGSSEEDTLWNSISNSLNEEGRKYAEQVRERLEKERDDKIAELERQMNKELESIGSSSGTATGNSRAETARKTFDTESQRVRSEYLEKAKQEIASITKMDRYRK